MTEAEFIAELEQRLREADDTLRVIPEAELEMYLRDINEETKH